MTPLNETLFRLGKYICVYCRKFNGDGCNSSQKSKRIQGHCSRYTVEDSMCMCNHRGGYISK